MNFPAIADAYISGVMDGSILVCRKVRQTIERHVRDLETGAARGLHYDAEAGARVCRFVSVLRPSKWPTPIELQPWQVALICILYGWKTADGFRRFNVAYIQLARKTGKSAIASALGLYHLTSDDERGAEVYSAALTEDQARRVFDEAVEMQRSTPVLRGLITSEGAQPCRKLHHRDSASYFKPLSSEKDVVQGTNPAFAVGDELHVWKTRKMYDDIKYGMGARKQPMFLGITTAPAAEDQTSFCSTQYNHAASVLDGAFEDDSFFAWITELDEELKDEEGNVIQPADDWEEEKNWIKACPNLGVTVTWAFMRQMVREAKLQPASLESFKRYSLNMRVGAVDAAISSKAWTRCGRDGDPIELRKQTFERLRKQICFLGLDLALVDDTSSLVAVFPPMNGRTKWEMISFFWIPADNIQQRVEQARVPYALWRDQGFLQTTPGEVTDHDYIAQEIMNLTSVFDVRELTYDPALASGLIKKVLTNGFKEDKVVKFAQTFMNYAAPCGDFVRAIRKQTIIHDSDPVLRWQISNLRWAKNHTGLVMPDKIKSIEKIDGPVAAIMGFGRANHPDNAKLITAKPQISRL